MLTTIACYAASYTLWPACKYIGASAGAHLGKNIISRVWRATTDKLRGIVSLELRRDRIYIVKDGVPLETNRRLKYIISCGEVTILDLGTEDSVAAGSEWELIELK